MNGISTMVFAFIVLFNTNVDAKAIEIESGLEISYEKNDGVLSFDDGYQIPIDESYKVLFLEGEIVKEANLITANDQTLIPIRVISDLFELSLDVDGDKITLGKGKINEITFNLNTNRAKTKTKKITLDHNVEVHGNYTYVPLRFIFDYYGYDMNYYDKNTKDGLGIITTASNIIIENKTPKRTTNTEKAKSKEKLNEVLNTVYNTFVTGDSFYDDTESSHVINEINVQIKNDLNNTKYIGEVSKYLVYENVNRILFDKETEIFYFEVVKDGNSYIYLLNDENNKLFMSKYFAG